MKKFLQRLFQPAQAANHTDDQAFAMTGETVRLTPEIIGDQRWYSYMGYRLCVHAMKDEIVFDNGILEPKHVRSIRFEVEYQNTTTQNLRYVSLQWLLYDRAGYSYEPEIRVQFFGTDKDQKLREGQLPAERRVRGWIAFQVPDHSQPDYLQFRRDYGVKDTLEIEI